MNPVDKILGKNEIEDGLDKYALRMFGQKFKFLSESGKTMVGNKFAKDNKLGDWKE
jgi:hypothetical protein